MVNGWIKLHRSLQKWEWWHNDKMLRVFLTILLNANHEDGRWQGYEVKRGQWITGRKALAEKTGYSERQIRTILKRLIISEELTIQTTNRFSVITVIKWDSYQLTETENDQPDANKRPATDQLPTTNKNEKNEKNEKEDIYRQVIIKKIQKAMAGKMNSTDFSNLPKILLYSEKQIDEAILKSKGKNVNYLITVLQNMPEEKPIDPDLQAFLDQRDN